MVYTGNVNYKNSTTNVVENNDSKENRKKDANKMYSNGMLLYKRRRYADAIWYLKKAFDNDPYYRTSFILAKCYMKTRQVYLAKKQLYKTIELKPDNTYARLELAKRYVIERADDKAKELFDECLKIDVNDTHVWLEYGKMYVKQGKLREAEQIFNNALEKINKEDNYIKLELAKLWTKQGKYDKAEQTFIECNTDDPEDRHVLLEWGRLYKRKGELENAQNCFEECISKNPNDRFPILELGKTYVIEKRYEEAEEQFQKCIKIRPTDTYAIYEMAMLKQIQGHISEAETWFKNCNKVEPKGIRAKLGLGRIWTKQGRYEEAKRILNERIVLEPRDVYARLEIEKILALENKDIKKLEMYDYLIANIGEEVVDEIKNKTDYFLRYQSNNHNKEKHGVLTISPAEVIKRMNIEESQKQSGKMLDIYNVKVEGCAYEGGYRGDGKELDYITILTLPKEKQEGKQEKETIIAIFPSKKLDLRERKREEIEQEIDMD